MSDDVKPYTTQQLIDAIAGFDPRVCLVGNITAGAFAAALRAGLADTERLDWLEEQRGGGVWHVASELIDGWACHSYETPLPLRSAIERARESATRSGREASG